MVKVKNPSKGDMKNPKFIKRKSLKDGFTHVAKWMKKSPRNR